MKCPTLLPSFFDFGRLLCLLSYVETQHAHIIYGIGADFFSECHCFLQCFDTVGWVTGRAFGPQKNLCQSSSGVLSLEKETDGNWLT